MASGYMMKLVWHVDELKLLHKDTFEVTKFSEYWFTMYGDNQKLYIGKVHIYIRMDLG